MPANVVMTEKIMGIRGLFSSISLKNPIRLFVIAGVRAGNSWMVFVNECSPAGWVEGGFIAVDPDNLSACNPPKTSGRGTLRWVECVFHMFDCSRSTVTHPLQA